MSKPSEADRRLPLDHYPKLRGSSEDALIRGYGMKPDEFERRVGSDRRKPPQRPETAAQDETGLRHGEPVSSGRRAALGDDDRWDTGRSKHSKTP